MAKAKTIELGIKFDTNGKEILGKLAIDSKQLADTIASVNKQAKDFQKQMSDWGFMAQGLDQAVGLVKGLENAIGDITAKYESFDKSMRAANTMAGKSGKELDNLKESVRELSKEVPVARDALANGLYQVISNGAPEDNWMEFLEKSARSSVGGIADLGQTVTVTSTILKNYALDWEKAGEIQDKIQLTAKNGETSFEQLAAALPRVSGNASALGVSVDELMASFATLTGVSGNTAEVSTQLAAVFTALLKPSKEASTLAAEMGIQFDAASIKAAGGFSNFLTKLKDSVAAYSAASGELEQSVMAKLFGSAESLRALGPLMGNLSEKFGENVDAMVESAGTMDTAFEEMAGSADAQRQVWENMYASIMDNVGVIAQCTKSTLYWLSVIGEAGVGTTKIVTLVKNFNIVATASTVKTRILAVSLSAYGVVSGRSAATQRLLNQAMAEGAISGTALKVALRGLMIASGVGAVMVALGYAVSFFMDKADEATESVDKLHEAKEEFVRVAGNARVELDNEAKRLKILMESTDNTTGAVKRLNDQYGSIFGNHKTAAEWYDILTRKSADYADMLGYEAQMKLLASQNAEDQLRYDESVREQSKWMKENRDEWHERRDPEGISYYTSNNAEFKKFEKEQSDLINGIEKRNKKLEDAIAHKNDIMRRSGIKLPALIDSPIETPLSHEGNGKTDKNKNKKITVNPEIPAGSLAEISKRISDIEAKIKLAVDKESGAALQRELDLLTEKKRSIEISYKFPNFKETELPEVSTLPTEIATIDIKTLDSLSPEIKSARDRLEELRKEGELTKEELSGAIGTISGAFYRLGDAIGGTADQWLQYAANVTQAVSTAIPQILTLIELHKKSKNEATGDAAAKAASSVADIPFVGPAMAVAAVASVIAAMASIPKFADGGIAFGPTLGLFGEYAGASNNPEVVAPLDKLRTLLNLSGESGGGVVKFKIDGRTLVGVLEKETNYRKRN